MLAYSSALLHGTGANTSLCATVSVAFQCSLGWLRQEENQCLAHPPAMARALPEKLRRLLGYDFGGPSLGFVGQHAALRLRLTPHSASSCASHSPFRALAYNETANVHMHMHACEQVPCFIWLLLSEACHH